MCLKKRKSGNLSINELIPMIVVLGVIVIIILFTGDFTLKMKDSADRSVCRNSALQQSLAINVKDDLVTLECPTYQIQFHDNYVLRNGKKMPVYVEEKDKDGNVIIGESGKSKGEMVKKFKKLDDGIVNRVIAEELRGCWYQFLEGKQSLFGKDLVVGSGKTFCYVCDEIGFDVDVSLEHVEGFYSFLKDKSMLKSDFTYYDYVVKDNGRICEKYKYPLVKVQDQVEGWDITCWDAMFAEHFFPVWFVFDEYDNKKEMKFIEEDANTWLSPYRPGEEFKFFSDDDYFVFLMRFGVSTKGEDTAVVKYVSGGDEAYAVYVAPKKSFYTACDSIRRGRVK